MSKPAVFVPDELDERLLALIAYHDPELADVARTSMVLAFNRGLTAGLERGIQSVNEVEARLHQLIIPFVR